MLFSEEYNIPVTELDTWFDPILERDVKLFIDPFLVYQTENPYFKSSYNKITNFFNIAFERAAEAEETSSDLRYKSLLRMTLFPEVKEICLGYASNNTAGAGAGPGFSKAIVGAIYDTIRLGLTDLKHFERIGLFNEGFGPDRISDITANLIKEDLVTYTQKICTDLKIKMQEVLLTNYKYDYTYGRWQDKNVILPYNSYYKRGVLLVPKEFLGRLPSINTDDFFDYCWDNNSEEIREQFSISLKSEVDKAKIIQIAREKQEWVRDYESFLENMRPLGYDLVTDPRGVYNWYKSTKEFAKKFPTVISATDNQSFNKAIKVIVDQFTHFIENNSGYKLLWDTNYKRPKTEEATQLLFTGITKHYCQANNIDISREVNLGRGPVDFKFSKGYSSRALLEVKLARNTKYLHGLEKQLIKYLEVEEITLGYFMIVCHNEDEMKKAQELEQVVADLQSKHSLELSLVIIDATPSKPSASNIL
ncbi:hypothetical protein CLV24_11915 [Pontibacter ummariensis]|uniref:Uncharacterized protein n=1 Tax=Pontibacter ummariensis TaxID=1610492 RepID=A0A239IUG0_9BACT|nr:hypothetical protein [Pontibacter ummariensis]PRY08965.1 hypothetical protein CLV24_11915 [Pontibacter ummariensis]SNS97209.1 hypothetical protein SAMN06296052_11915 [Pontibacter ummariensis]